MNTTGHITGHIAADGTLVLSRTFRAPVEDVWASITDSERLSRWFGTWTGDPREGFVMFTMNSEAEPVPPTRYDIDTCEPPHRLAVNAIDDFGHWRLVADLTSTGGTTTLELRQLEIDVATVPDVGPGWEWYLDRLVAAVHAEEPPSLADFESRYMPMADEYRALIPR